MKKLIALLLAMLMVMGLVACGAQEEVTEEVTEVVEQTTEETPEETEMVTIGTIQFMQHASLDEAYQGFVDGLAEAGYNEGENLTLNFQNASGEVANCQQICEVFANSDTDLVLAIATPAAQSAVNVLQETDVPVLFTAVTDAVGAGLVDSNEVPGKNVTGTLDMPVIADQIAVIKDVLPEAQTLAILYTSSEANSEIQAEEAKAAAEALGMDVIIQTSSSSNDIPQVISSVVGSADAIYIPSDNAFASAMATVNAAAVENQIPVFCAVEAMIAEGGIATTAIDYYELGKQTAAMAVRVLNGEAASEMSVETQKDCALVVNETFAASVGVEIPAEIVSEASVVY